MSERASTWVHVELAFHRLGDALQLDGLQGAVGVRGGWEAAQRLPDESGHLPDREDLQQLAVDGVERPQEHRLRTSEPRSVMMGWNIKCCMRGTGLKTLFKLAPLLGIEPAFVRRGWRLCSPATGRSEWT